MRYRAGFRRRAGRVRRPPRRDRRRERRRRRGAAYSPTKSYLNAVTVQYAKELADTGVLVNAGCPGYVATELNGHRGTRTPEQGAAIFLELATLPDGGPSGTFRDDTGIQPW